MRTVVAIPARDEEARIGPCLRALLEDTVLAPDHVVVFVNNSTDATAARARAAAGPDRISVIEAVLPPPLATAGHARGAAMRHAADLAGPDGILLTTDADGRVDPVWLAANLDALDAGAELVAGWVELEPADWLAIPLALHEDDAREREYDALCDRIHARLDPDPHDPLPRHTQEPGASLAMTAAAFRRCGGVPAQGSGEDRALVRAMRRVDARIRHAPEVHVHVSGRLDGRAAGGMADTITRRMRAPDTHLDDRLEPALAVARRAGCHRLFRSAWTRNDPAAIALLANRLRLAPGAIRDALGRRFCGEGWFRLEQASPALARRRVAVADLPGELAAARAILAAGDPDPAFQDTPPGTISGRP